MAARASTKVTVLGAEGDNSFVITADGIFGAGVSISLNNVEEAVEVDGLEGNDTFFILFDRRQHGHHRYRCAPAAICST